MNYGELNTYMSILLGEDSTTFFSSNDRKVVINQACRMLSSQLDFLRNVVDFTTTSGIGSYTLPPDFANWGDGVDLYDGSVTTTLIPASIAHLRALNADWEDQSGQPAYYASENGVLYLYPAPDNAYNVRLSYQPIPNTIGTQSTDVPFYNDPRTTAFHDIIALYGAWMLLLKDREFDAADRVQQTLERRKIDFMEALRVTGGPVQALWSNDYGNPS